MTPRTIRPGQPTQAIEITHLGRTIQMQQHHLSQEQVVEHLKQHIEGRGK